jgi:hypothetical protein
MFERHLFITGIKDGFVEFDYHAVNGNLCSPADHT